MCGWGRGENHKWLFLLPCLIDDRTHKTHVLKQKLNLIILLGYNLNGWYISRCGFKVYGWLVCKDYYGIKSIFNYCFANYLLE